MDRDKIRARFRYYRLMVEDYEHEIKDLQQSIRYMERDARDEFQDRKELESDLRAYRYEYGKLR